MMQNSTFTIYITSGKSKSVLSFSMGTQTSINGVIPDTAISLRDFGAQKVEMKVPINNKANGGKAPDIKYLDDTKEIAGYTCHRAQITGANGNTTDVYYTDQLPAYEGKKGEYKGLKGFPLEFSSNDRGMTIKFSAISVTKQALTDDVFAVPAGYTLQAMPAMGQHGMGGGQ
jgi:GLPGLI family protein